MHNAAWRDGALSNEVAEVVGIAWPFNYIFYDPFLSVPRGIFELSVGSHMINRLKGTRGVMPVLRICPFVQFIVVYIVWTGGQYLACAIVQSILYPWGVDG